MKLNKLFAATIGCTLIATANFAFATCPQISTFANPAYIHTDSAVQSYVQTDDGEQFYAASPDARLMLRDGGAGMASSAVFVTPEPSKSQPNFFPQGKGDFGHTTPNCEPGSGYTCIEETYAPSQDVNKCTYANVFLNHYSSGDGTLSEYRTVVLIKKS